MVVWTEVLYYYYCYVAQVGKAAEDACKALSEHSADHGAKVYNHNDILRHNRVVFRDGEGALEVSSMCITVCSMCRYYHNY